MSRTLTKEKPIRDVFVKSIIDAVSNPISVDFFDDDVWEEKPVNTQMVCRDWLKEPLFPLQLDFVDAMLGKTATEFSTQYEEGHAFWGKGSGKDRTISKLQLILVMKLLKLQNPQKYLREKYGCSIGNDDAIDIGNMSINARQAQNVFFKKFKTLVKNTINPKTGKNWFAEQGVDLREGYDIQNTEVRFPKGITCHSLNSETNTGEGLNLILATIDEFGAFPVDKGFGLLDAVRDTVTSRFLSVGKVCVFSFKYYNNDPMHILYEKEKNNPKVYSSKHATYEVNPMVTKASLASKYSRNPESAKMTFECEGGVEEGGYITKKYMLSHCFDPIYENPVKGDLLSVDSVFLNSLQFKDWFKGTEGRLMAIHVDLATGNKEAKNDCVGFAMTHVDKMYPKMDEKLRKDLFSEGIIIEMTNETNPDMNVVRKGVVHDLVLQILAKNNTEVQMSDVRNFILRLKNQLGFNIIMVTYDGWESKDSIQLLQAAGIQAEKFSVDTDNAAYETWKELMYQQLVKCYPHSIAEREARELIVTESGKVDHPEKSWQRELTENNDKGSKDTTDAMVASAKKAYDLFSLEADVFFG